MTQHSAILICDDDPAIRSAMRRTLRGYTVAEAGSPREAIDMLRSGCYDVVVSDFSLDAETDGLDLLQHVRVSYPGTIRFLVTGNRDIEVAARALNEGAVHRYFQKPWNDVTLRASLQILLHSRR